MPSPFVSAVFSRRLIDIASTLPFYDQLRWHISSKSTIVDIMLSNTFLRNPINLLLIAAACHQSSLDIGPCEHLIRHPSFAAPQMSFFALFTWHWGTRTCKRGLTWSKPGRWSEDQATGPQSWTRWKFKGQRLPGEPRKRFDNSEFSSESILANAHPVWGRWGVQNKALNLEGYRHHTQKSRREFLMGI